MSGQVFYDHLMEDDYTSGGIGFPYQSGELTYRRRWDAPKLEVSGSQAFIDWIEGKDLRRPATDETAEYPK